MNRLHNILLIAAISILTFSSCGTFLDVKPKGKVLPKTDQEYMAVLNEMLYQVETYDNGAGIVLPGPTELVDLEAITDNLDANLEDYIGGEKSGLPLYEGEQINRRQTYWKNLYEYIRNCNIIIAEVKGRDSDLARNMTGTCLAIKGICYYHLMRSFCVPYKVETAASSLGLPLVDSFDIEDRPQRSNLKSTGEYVCALLKESISYGVLSEDYLFTKDVTMMFLAKTLFWMQDWDGTVLLCEELLERHPLTEIQDYSSVIQELNKKQGEILAKSFEEGSPTNYNYTNAKKAASRRPVNKSLLDLFGSAPDDDVRYGIIFGAKRMNQKTICYRVRSSELVLMLAESYCHLKKDSKALEMLNLLRSKRIKKCVAYTPETLPEVGKRLVSEDAMGMELTPLLSAIFDERRKELFMEGDRWYELKRNGCPRMYVISNLKKYTTYEYLYTFPINRNDVELGGLKQNEGYKY